MLYTYFHRTRNDGVKLFRTLDAVVDENGEIVKDENGLPIPRGFKILQNETQRLYDHATDVENAPYTYSETDEKIEEAKNTVDNPTE